MHAMFKSISHLSRKVRVKGNSSIEKFGTVMGFVRFVAMTDFVRFGTMIEFVESEAVVEFVIYETLP